jgi:hypothetical protein
MKGGDFLKVLLNKNMIRIIEQSGPNKRAIYELTNPENWKT